MNPPVESLLRRRLEEIGCQRLPASVLRVLRQRIDAAVASAASRIVHREVTTNKIAGIFAHQPPAVSRRGQGGRQGDESPLDQSRLLELHPQLETKRVTGTAARTTILPP